MRHRAQQCPILGVVSTASMEDPRRPGTGARLGTALSRRAAIDAATDLYLASEPLDMSVLAAALGIGRSTLYRLVGNREDLLSTVLAEATVRTFRWATKHAQGTGADLVLDVFERFAYAVVGAAPLLALATREPVLFVRLVLLPGPVEATAARMIAEVLEAEMAAGRLELPLPAGVMAQAMIRMSEGHVYAHLLGRDQPEIDTALDLVAALLGADRPTRADTEPRTIGCGGQGDCPP